MNPLEQRFIERIKILNSDVWRTDLTNADIDRWLANFTGQVEPVEKERIHALHLLSNFVYFGSPEIRILLRAVYRDLYRYPIVQELRSAGLIRSPLDVETEFIKVRDRTRFLPMGNPAESGSLLLYFFRQENRLPKSLFAYERGLFSKSRPSGVVEIDSEIDLAVFIDDVLGSGSQAIDYSQRILGVLDDAAKRSARNFKTKYFVLFAKNQGLQIARKTLFDTVRAVHEFDVSEELYNPDNRAFLNQDPEIDIDVSRRVMSHYGTQVFKEGPLGWRDGQLLLGMHHNIPDNTLPVVWSSRENWYPIFRRYEKLYS